uniref:Uncharacterized protein n=1 Tax=Entomoneis paludosa TaxID=265537 RepID=A0A7S2YR51_9STRA
MKKLSRMPKELCRDHVGVRKATRIMYPTREVTVSTADSLVARISRIGVVTLGGHGSTIRSKISSRRMNESCELLLGELRSCHVPQTCAPFNQEYVRGRVIHGQAWR